MSAERTLAIMSGGQNSRLQPLSSTIYKPFLPIHGMSLVARHLVRASLCGIRDAVVVIDEPDPVIEQFLATSAPDGMSVEVLVVPGPTAAKIGAVAERRPSARPLLVCLGDTYAKVDLGTLAAHPARASVDSAIVLARYRLPFGVVRVDGGLVTQFEEKPQLDECINTGYLALGPAALEHLASTQDLAATLEQLTADGDLAVAATVDAVTVVDSLLDLALAHERLAPSPLRGDP